MEKGISKSDVACIVMSYLKDLKFEKTVDSFQKEAYNLLEGYKETEPLKNLHKILNEYIELKTEQSKKEEFIKSFSVNATNQLCMNVLSSMYNLLEVFNKTSNLTPAPEKKPQEKKEKKSKEDKEPNRKPLRQIPQMMQPQVPTLTNPEALKQQLPVMIPQAIKPKPGVTTPTQNPPVITIEKQKKPKKTPTVPAPNKIAPKTFVKVEIPMMEIQKKSQQDIPKDEVDQIINTLEESDFEKILEETGSLMTPEPRKRKEMTFTPLNTDHVTPKKAKMNLEESFLMNHLFTPNDKPRVEKTPQPKTQDDVELLLQRISYQ